MTESKTKTLSFQNYSIMKGIKRDRHQEAYEWIKKHGAGLTVRQLSEITGIKVETLRLFVNRENVPVKRPEYYEDQFQSNVGRTVSKKI